MTLMLAPGRAAGNDPYAIESCFEFERCSKAEDDRHVFDESAL